MLNFNNNLLKDSMAEIIKAQFGYIKDVETKLNYPRPVDAKPAHYPAWQYFVALFKTHKLQEPKQS